MGVMQSLFGLVFGGAREARALGATVTGVAEVFRPNATRALELGHEAYMAAHATHGAEFAHVRPGWFDTFVNGLNRLPRPLLALGTLGLFVHAMVDPDSFAHRMRGLAEVPEPLWWLLGAVVAFYFGAREAHHLRAGAIRKPAPPLTARSPAAAAAAQAPAATPVVPPTTARTDTNAALADWQAAASR